MPDDIICLTEFKNYASGWIERLQSPVSHLTLPRRLHCSITSHGSKSSSNRVRP